MLLYWQGVGLLVSGVCLSSKREGPAKEASVLAIGERASVELRADLDDIALLLYRMVIAYRDIMAMDANE